MGDGKIDRNEAMYILAAVVTVGFFVLIGMLMFRSVSETGPILLLFGALAQSYGTVVGYFFGSSKSSADKTALLTTKREV